MGLIASDYTVSSVSIRGGTWSKLDPRLGEAIMIEVGIDRPDWHSSLKATLRYAPGEPPGINVLAPVNADARRALLALGAVVAREVANLVNAVEAALPAGLAHYWTFELSHHQSGKQYFAWTVFKHNDWSGSTLVIEDGQFQGGGSGGPLGPIIAAPCAALNRVVAQVFPVDKPLQG